VPVANFSIAVNRVRSKSEAVDFFNVSCWRELGERVANYKRRRATRYLLKDTFSTALGKLLMAQNEAR
jgi:hypothetical protein